MPEHDLQHDRLRFHTRFICICYFALRVVAHIHTFDYMIEKLRFHYVKTRLFFGHYQNLYDPFYLLPEKEVLTPPKKNARICYIEVKGIIRFHILFRVT